MDAMLRRPDVAPSVAVDVEDYLTAQRKDGEYSGPHECLAAAELYGIRLHVHAVSSGGLQEYVYEPGDGVVPVAALRMCLRSSHYWATCAI